VQWDGKMSSNSFT